RAAAALGLRHFGQAKRVLDRLERQAVEGDDLFLEIEAKLARARLFLAQNQAKDALELLRDSPGRFPYDGERAEWLATLGLTRACLGDAEASALLDEAAAAARTVEVRTLVPAAQAILDLQLGEDASTRASEALHHARHFESFDPFITAYRACPKLLATLARDERLLELVIPV